MSDQQHPAPISWDALAAELAATRENAERRGDADPGTWDAVAKELAARVAERPVEEGEVPAVPVEDEPDAAPPPQDPAPADVPAGEPRPEPQPEPEPEQLLDPAQVRGGLEALLFVMDNPVDEETLAAALRCPIGQVRT